MNPNRLAKLYDTLTPRERIPLIQAAAVREDETDRQRLVNSAPVLKWALPDYYGTAKALREVATAHTLTQMELTAVYWHLRHDFLLGLEDDSVDDKFREARWHAELMVTYKFHVCEKAWQVFCDELKVDSAVNCLGLVSDNVKQFAFLLNPTEPLSEAQMREVLPNVELVTVSSVLESFKALLEFHESRWK